MSPFIRFLTILIFIVISIPAKDSVNVKNATIDSSRAVLLIEGKNGSVQIVRGIDASKISVYRMEDTQKKPPRSWWSVLIALLNQINWWALVVILFAFIFRKQFVEIFNAVSILIRNLKELSITKDGMKATTGITESKDITHNEEIMSAKSEKKLETMEEKGSVAGKGNVTSEIEISSIRSEDLGFEEKKILRTLYNESFKVDKNFNKRFTFNIFSPEFSIAIKRLLSLRLVGNANPDQYAITNEGIEFIEKNKLVINLNGPVYF